MVMLERAQRHVDQDVGWAIAPRRMTGHDRDHGWCTVLHHDWKMTMRAQPQVPSQRSTYELAAALELRIAARIRQLGTAAPAPRFVVAAHYTE